MFNNEFDKAVKFFLTEPGYMHILSMNKLIIIFFVLFDIKLNNYFS